MSDALREAIESAVDQIQEVTPEPPVQTPVEPPVQGAQESESKAEERARDELGRFAAKQKEEEPPQPAVGASPTPRKRPDAWKKEFTDRYDRIAAEDPTFADYLDQREQEFRRGVGAYKAEVDRARHLVEAVAPFTEELQRYGINPAQHIHALFSAHRMLALGTPEQKAGLFVKLARDYGVPIEQLFVRDNSGQVYLNPMLQQQQAAPQFRVEDIDARVAQVLEARASRDEVRRFREQADKYPHADALTDSMAQLLTAGVVSNLDDAYQTALRLPQHSALFEAQQSQQRALEETRQAEEKRKAAEAARRKAVSPRSVTPTGAGTNLGQAKSVRSAYETNLDALDGRV